MKQPELGRKIQELRTVKGLTQEELVEKCNISVRTIQRIEAGEVMPRIYTVKMILAALEFDLSKISVEDTNIIDSIAAGFKRLLLLDIDVTKPSTFLIKQLNIAWVIGIVYFLLGFFEAAVEFYRYEGTELISSKILYTIIKLLVLLSYIFFQRGFILVGGLFQNYLLRIISFILIFGTILVVGYDIASIFYESVEREFVLGAEALTFGGIGIVYGISLFRLHRSIGDACKLAGIFEMIAGGFFLTIVLFFMGFIFLIPAELLEIIILYKAAEIIKAKISSDSQEGQSLLKSTGTSEG